MNLLLLPIYTRYLSRTEFGIFSYTTAVCAFLVLLGNLSIHSYVLRHYYDCQNDTERRRLFGTIFGFLFVYNGFLLGAEFLILPGLFRILEAQVPFAPYMQLALLNNVIEIIGILPLVYFRVKEEAGRFIALTLSQAMLNGGLSLYLIVVVGTGILGRYYGVLGANLVLLVVYLAVISCVSSWTWDTAQIKKAIVFCLPLTGAGALALITTISDRILLERFVSLDQLGVYSVGFAIAYGLNALSNGVYKAVEPEVYRLAAVSQLDEQILVMKRVIVLLLVGLGALIIAFSRELLMILTGPAFHDAYKIVLILMPAVVLRGVSIPVATYAVAINRTRCALLANLAGALMSLGMNLVLLPFLGIYGAALSSMVSWLVILYAYKVGTESASGLRWRFEVDVLFMLVVFGLSAMILQIEMSWFVVALLVKGLLVSGPLFLLAWWQLSVRRAKVV